MNSIQARGSTAALARLAEQGASPAQMAEALLDCWQRMHDALAPIVGQRGVAALYSRALHVTAKDHPWLAASPSNITGAIDLLALRNALLARHGAESAAAGDAFIDNFTALLSSLVGQALADHLIGPTRIETSRGNAAQDT
jgi:hypothetical protein